MKETPAPKLTQDQKKELAEPAPDQEDRDAEAVALLMEAERNGYVKPYWTLGKKS